VREKYNGLVAKFEQNLDISSLLLATRPAILMQFNRGKPPDVRYDLMRVRDYIASKKNITRYYMKYTKDSEKSTDICRFIIEIYKYRTIE